MTIIGRFDPSEERGARNRKVRRSHFAATGTGCMCGVLPLLSETGVLLAVMIIREYNCAKVSTFERTKGCSLKFSSTPSKHVQIPTVVFVKVTNDKKCSFDLDAEWRCAGNL